MYRIIDANINRAKEGLRVCEEIIRFILNNKASTSRIKQIRHRLKALVDNFPVSRNELLSGRESVKDAGRKIQAQENIRTDFRDIFFANISRVKESLRVLEEFFKLIDRNTAVRIKSLRYDIYDFEKKVAQRF